MTRTRPVVFDVDGVLADFQQGYANMALTLSRPKPMEGDWDSYLDPLVWCAIESSPRFWVELDPLVDVSVLNQVALLSYSRDVYFATSRVGVNPMWQTVQWLRRWLSITVPHVVITPRKGEFAKVVNAEYLIDDKAGNAVYTQYESPTTNVYLLDKPYNQFPQDNLGTRVKRVKSVEEFLGDIG